MTSLRDDYVIALEAENETLRGRIGELEELLGVRIEVPIELGLTAQQGKLLGLLLKREIVTKDMALTALYGGRPGSDEAEAKIIDVFVCHIRRKLKAFGIEVGTQWGRGYYLSAAAKAKVQALLPKTAAA